MRRDLTVPLLFGLGGAVALALTQRKTIMIYGAKALDAGKEVAFATAIGSRRRSAAQYAPIILRVARETNLDPFLIFALGDRESQWGDALTPKGPGGTGDFGHGRGLMQIDDRSNAAWLAANDWRDPYKNVRRGAEILLGKMRFFTGKSIVKGYTDGMFVSIDKSAEKLGVAPGKYRDPRPLSGTRLIEASIAAYNTGEANVLMAIAAGLPAETTTAHGDYLTDVWRRMTSAVARFA